MRRLCAAHAPSERRLASSSSSGEQRLSLPICLDPVCVDAVYLDPRFLHSDRPNLVFRQPWSSWQSFQVKKQGGGGETERQTLFVWTLRV